jgi:hypothetical protein
MDLLDWLARVGCSRFPMRCDLASCRPVASSLFSPLRHRNFLRGGWRSRFYP